MAAQLRILPAFVFLALLLVPTLYAKAGAEKQLIVPDLPTAKEQYGYALMFQKSQTLSGDRQRRMVQLANIRKCYEQVIINFPDDTVHTPLAYLELGETFRPASDYKGAIHHYESVMKLYPENEYVQARCKFSIAQCYDALGDFKTGKAYYKEIIDTYMHSDSTQIQFIVKRAKAMYVLARQQKLDPEKEKKGLLSRFFNRASQTQ